jgi:SAM-dependent methyltransferase
MSTDPAFFQRLYADQPDPWGYESSPYEAEKYALCLGLLGDRRFARGLEIGCSIGVLSMRIAERCDTFLGLDGAPLAISRARDRGVQNAEFRVAVLPGDWPDGAWDLIVLSEVLYFFDAEDIGHLARHVARTLAPGGAVLIASYLGDTETELDGPASEARFLDCLARLRPMRAARRVARPRFQALVLE